MLYGLEAEREGAAYVHRREGARLSEALGEAHPGFSTFITLPSNVRAIESAMLFAGGFVPFVALCGATGWGKSHLLQAASDMIRRESGRIVPVCSAVDWLAQPARTDSQRPLILDDVQAAMQVVRSRQQLRIVLERRVRSGKPTLLAFTTDRSPKPVRFCLPCGREWTHGHLPEPSREERELFVRRLAQSEGLGLSETLARLMSRHIDGNARTILGAIQRLSLSSNAWTDRRSVLRGLGLLEPFLSQDGGLDLRDCVHETVLRYWMPVSTPVTATEMSIFIMLRLLGLNEHGVASYFRTTEGDVYHTASRLDRMHGSGALAPWLDMYSEAVLRTLQEL